MRYKTGNHKETENWFERMFWRNTYFFKDRT